MQAVVRNALADPYILGINSGASTGAALAIFFGVGAGFADVLQGRPLSVHLWRRPWCSSLARQED
ncbi:hypothetical protein N579_02640 [Corynebacterium pseudodiphtheriticum 090104]|nr:hypothetical protein N579_02640 [Corynebacterium pseudodiphtheriticum 090104]